MRREDKRSWGSKAPAQCAPTRARIGQQSSAKVARGRKAQPDSGLKTVLQRSAPEEGVPGFHALIRSRAHSDPWKQVEGSAPGDGAPISPAGFPSFLYLLNPFFRVSLV